LHQALLALTYLSAVPYIVNTYLGLRHLNNKRLQEGLISACFYIYTMSILLNFWIQHMYVFYLIPGGFTMAKLCYLLAYYCILKDDIHLMGYFRYKVKDPSDSRKQDQGVGKDQEQGLAKDQGQKLDKDKGQDQGLRQGQGLAKGQDQDLDTQARSQEKEKEKEKGQEKGQGQGQGEGKSQNEVQEQSKDQIRGIKDSKDKVKDLPVQNEDNRDEEKDSEKEQVKNNTDSYTDVNVEDQKLERFQIEPIYKPNKSRFNWDFFIQLISRGKLRAGNWVL
ncbi:MAG: hypothetical protein WD512_00795, partial [Candidatus Paceibacterota bacterium]